jgi:Protein of unknown function (DUF2786)
MADRADIERVAKILARANSDSEGEAETALNSAYSRMKRDRVTLSDLLSLPETALYQDALVRLAELIVKDQGELSHSAKRELYSAYLKRIVEKFSGGRSGGGDSKNQEREEAARAYERRRQEEEARRGQGRNAPPPRPEPPKPPPSPPPSQPFKRQNVKTEDGEVDLPFRYDPYRFPLDFSVSAFFLFFFGSNSYIGSIYSYPKRAFELLFRSCLVGGLTFVAVYIALVLIINRTNFAPVLYVGYAFFVNLGLTAFVFIFITSYIYYERDWYPRGPRHGETDFVSIIKSLWRLTLALLWRAYGAWAWISNRAYSIGYKWQASREKSKKSSSK